MKTRTILLEIFFFVTVLFLLFYLHLEKRYYTPITEEVKQRIEWRRDVIEHQLYLEEVAMKGDIWIRNKSLIPIDSSIN